MKKIFVPLKRVPDWQLKVKPSADGITIDQTNLKWIINTFDEIAVEEAIRIRDKGVGFTEVVLCLIGPKEGSEQLRSALAMGADRAIHILTDEDIDSSQATKILAHIVKRDNYELVIIGEQAIDSDSGQTGQRLSVRLGYQQASFTSKIDIDGESLTVVREVDGGLETLKLKLPAVVSTDLRLNEPRLRSLPGIVAAKKKPVEEIQLSDIPEVGSKKVKVKKLSVPPSRPAGQKVSSVSELISKLKEEKLIG